jgi:hypothetical protein
VCAVDRLRGPCVVVVAEGVSGSMTRSIPTIRGWRMPTARELGFSVFCERRRGKGIPLAELSALVHGVRVDAYFRAHALAVELGGDGNRRTPGPEPA